MPDVDFLPVIVNRGDQPKFVPPDIENREPIDLICRWKRGPKSSEGGVIGLTDNREPMLQGHAGFWMEPPKVHQSPPRNNMHSAMLSQYEIAVKYMPGAMPSEVECGVKGTSRESDIRLQIRGSSVILPPLRANNPGSVLEFASPPL